jgi:hypothetical protein
VFEVYGKSIGGLEFVVPRLLSDLRDAMTRPAAEAAEALARIAEEVQAVRSEEDHAFQVGLDTSRAELHRAKEVAEDLASGLSLEDDKTPLFWLQAIGVTVDPDGPVRSRVALSPDNLEVPGVPGVGKGIPPFQATWKRTDALRNEHLQFLAPGHRLVDGAYQLLDGSNLGRAALLGRNLGAAARGGLFAVAIFVADLPDLQRFLPAGLIARARAEVGRDTATLHLRYDPETRAWSALDRGADVRLLRELDKNAIDRQGGDRNLADEAAALLADPSILSSLELGLDAASTRLFAQAEDVAQEGADTLERLWAAEMAYFNAVVDSGNAEAQEGAREELRVREELLQRVRALRPRLDGLMLVFGT